MPAVAQDSQLVDATKEEAPTLTRDDLQFEEFSSCEEMTDIIADFVKENIEDRPYPYYYGLEDDMMDIAESAADGADGGNAPQPTAAQNKTVRSDSNDFSQTNIQKDGVDEPDILKTDGTYLYYYNAQEHEISIMRGPLSMTTQTLDLDRVSIVNTITVPERMNQVDLFLYEDTMVIVGQRYSQTTNPTAHFDRSTRTIIAAYDISSVHDLELEHYQEVDGWRQDSRLDMRDGKLYVLSQLQFNRWYGYPTGADDIDVVVTKDAIMPKTLSVTKGQNGLNITTTSANCDDIHYLFPTKEQMKHMSSWPSFTVVTTLDLDTYAKDTNIIFGQPSQLHMSQNSLYLAQGVYMPTQFSCPPNARCAESFFWGGQQHTLIHGFDLGGSTSLDYK
jgi:hypothetical protein